MHEIVQAFLSKHTLFPLPGGQAGQADMDKAGILPYRVINGELRFCVMKPVARHSHLPPPLFQICKGTRQEKTAQGWRDVTPHSGLECEPLPATALREGMEEIGLPLKGIITLYEAGAYAFASASGRGDKFMWLLAAQMDDTPFTDPDPHAAATAAIGWLTADEFDIEGRQDHRYIVKDIAARLAQAQKP